MARAGRKRKAVARTPSGQPSRAGQCIANRELLAQRAQAVGVVLTEKREALLRGARVGTALGVLWARGREGRPGITERQYRAGEALEGLWRRWAAMAACPPRTQVNSDGGGPAPELDADRWRRTKREFETVQWAVWRLPAGVPAWRLIERVVMDGVIPDALNEPNPSLWASVHGALDEIGKHFRIPKSEAA